MIAVDTNVIVRLIVGDDDEQLARAARLLERNDIFVSLAVLVETEWVLPSRYGMDRARITRSLTAIANLSAVVVEADDDVRWALTRGELAAFVHPAATRPVEGLATFGRKLARPAGDDSPVRVEAVP